MAAEGSDSGEDMMKEKKVVLGSRPPGCMNKCHGCNPCRAALVISSHHGSDMEPSLCQRDREGYYLMSWKCKCGNKLFEPWHKFLAFLIKGMYIHISIV